MFKTGESQVKYYCRAKFYKTIDGAMKLAKVQELSYPSFRLPGYEEQEEKQFTDLDLLLAEAEAEASVPKTAIPSIYDETAPYQKENTEENRNAWKNLHRAKMNAFDKILCNPDLDTFATFTLSPESVGSRASWQDCYHRLKIWLSDRVQRKGLKYVICPERHKLGGIHFHAIMNSKALQLTPATNAHTGKPLMHNGKPLYNISDFKFGFTSAEVIETKVNDRENVAKYIFKYMGKQGVEGKIGGRYALIGGELRSPIYLYGDNPEEFIPFTDDEIKKGGFYRQTEHEGIKYKEWSFI